VTTQSHAVQGRALLGLWSSEDPKMKQQAIELYLSLGHRDPAVRWLSPRIAWTDRLKTLTQTLKPVLKPVGASIMQSFIETYVQTAIGTSIRMAEDYIMYGDPFRSPIYIDMTTEELIEACILDYRLERT